MFSSDFIVGWGTGLASLCVYRGVFMRGTIQKVGFNSFLANQCGKGGRWGCLHMSHNIGNPDALPFWKFQGKNGSCDPIPNIAFIATILLITRVVTIDKLFFYKNIKVQFCCTF